MANLLDHHLNDEAASSSMSKMEDNLSNSDGPLIKKRDRDHIINKNRNTLGDKEHWSNDSYERKDYISNNEGKQNVQCLWSLIIILAIIGICNLLLSVTVIVVLRVSQGMESLEVIPDQDLVKFYGRTDLDNVCIESGVCEGFGDEPVELTGDGGGIEIDIKSRFREKPRSRFQIDSSGISVSKVNAFEVTENQNDDTVFFSTNFPNIGLPDGIETLEVRLAQTHRVVAPMNQNLRIEANRTSVHGAEGATLEAKNIVWTANNDVFVSSKNGDVVIEAKNGIVIDVKSIPIAPDYLPSHAGLEGQFKVCVCMPQGKLFKVPIKDAGTVRVNCARISTSSEYDPCL